LYRRTREGEAQRLAASAPHDADRDRRAGCAAHPIDGFRDVALLDRHVVDGHDDVARQDSRGGGGRARERLDDRDLAVVDTHIEADAGVVARGADPDLLVLSRIEIARMRVELLDDAADRALDELTIVDAGDVLAAHAFHDLGDEGHRVRRDGISDLGMHTMLDAECRPDRGAHSQTQTQHDTDGENQERAQSEHSFCCYSTSLLVRSNLSTVQSRPDTLRLYVIRADRRPVPS
jgi:hypothetical protein